MSKLKSHALFLAPLTGALLLAGAANPAQAQLTGPSWPTEIPPTAPQPSAAKGMEGTWKIATPATTLKPVSGEVPFTAEGRAAYDANKKLKAQRKFDDYDITTSRCSTAGVPRLMLMPGRFQIWNQQDVVTFDFEWNRAIRQIDMRGVEHKEPEAPPHIGITTGRWEGDVLLAETKHASDRTLIDDLLPRSYDTKIIERFRLIDADTLEDHITIEDGSLFTKPWEAVLTFKRQPDVLLPDDICLDRLDAQRTGKAGKKAS